MADNNPNQPPAGTPPGWTPPVQDPPAPDAKPEQDNEAAKYRRLHEKAETERQALAAKLKEIEDAQLSETERLKKEAQEAKEERDRLRVENARQKIAAEFGLDSELTDFLNGDEAAMRAQAETLKGKTGGTGAGTTEPPKAGGTSTQPPRGGAPSIDEQIEAAYKAGNQLQAIRLKREKAFGAG